jgi:hypothetical protein
VAVLQAAGVPTLDFPREVDEESSQETDRKLDLCGISEDF